MEHRCSDSKPEGEGAVGSRDSGYFFAILMQPLSHFYEGSFLFPDCPSTVTMGWVA